MRCPGGLEGLRGEASSSMNWTFASDQQDGKGNQGGEAVFKLHDWTVFNL